jgi:hypothetical protein
MSDIFRLQEAYDSVRTEVMYSILIEFWVLKNLVRLIKMCLNEMYSKIHVGKRFLLIFLFQMV